MTGLNKLRHHCTYRTLKGRGARHANLSDPERTTRQAWQSLTLGNLFGCRGGPTAQASETEVLRGMAYLLFEIIPLTFQKPKFLVGYDVEIV